MADKKIIERVKKLLALGGDGANENESAAAMAAAQRLMTEHAILEKTLASLLKPVVTNGTRVPGQDASLSDLSLFIDRYGGHGMTTAERHILDMGRVSDSAVGGINRALRLLKEEGEI